jgi:hypothetical protein
VERGVVPEPQKQLEEEPQFTKVPHTPGEEQEGEGAVVVIVTVEVEGGRVVVVAVMLN